MKVDLTDNTMQLDYGNMNILLIPDMHMPSHHPDSLDFLYEVKSIYQPNLTVNLGDLADFHNISFHDSDPDYYGAGRELEKMQEAAKELEEIFPEMIIVGSNHGDLPLRKALAHGLPRHLFRPYNEIYDVGAGWLFIDDLTIKSKTEPDLYICHNIRKNALQIAQQRGQRFACGHYHENFEVRYCGNPNELLWSVMSGCLIDKKSLAFAYDKLNLNRPVLGATVIENGYPQLIPMVLDKKGRWDGRIR